MGIESALRAVLTHPWFLSVWAVTVVAALAVLIWDLRRNNPEIMPLMRVVWLFTVTYSGLLGLAIYWWSGRKQIAADGTWRRGARSTAHCYSGCGFGEILGITITVGLLALGTFWVVLVTFTLAYLFGFALTAGPLIQEGMGVSQALKDAFTSETASITVMEAVAIGTDLWLAGEAGMGDAIFWSALVFSLSAGFVAAYFVNVLLVHWGVKEGMHDPREMAQHA